jgi:tRNA(Arg) A34 adenosine deaminase TadA
VLVKDGEIVGRGFHTYTQAKHAEVVALEEAGDRRAGPRSTSRWNRVRIRAARRLARTLWCGPEWRA